LNLMKNQFKRSDDVCDVFSYIRVQV